MADIVFETLTIRPAGDIILAGSPYHYLETAPSVLTPTITNGATFISALGQLLLVRIWLVRYLDDIRDTLMPTRRGLKMR